MPIKDAGKKAMRSDARKALANRRIRGTYRSKIKSTLAAISSGDIAEAKKLFVDVQKTLDKAAKKGVIKKDTAARRKSRLNKMIKDAK